MSSPRPLPLAPAHRCMAKAMLPQHTRFTCTRNSHAIIRPSIHSTCIMGWLAQMPGAVWGWS